MKKKEKINLKVPNENKNNSLEIHEYLIVYKDEKKMENVIMVIAL